MLLILKKGIAALLTAAMMFTSGESMIVTETKIDGSGESYSYVIGEPDI